MRPASFWKDESGQDLIEYTLLMAMICLASAGLVYGSGDAVHRILATTESNLDSAKTAAGTP